jgi:hypothetical protein
VLQSRVMSLVYNLCHTEMSHILFSPIYSYYTFIHSNLEDSWELVIYQQLEKKADRAIIGE